MSGTKIMLGEGWGTQPSNPQPSGITRKQASLPALIGEELRAKFWKNESPEKKPALSALAGKQEFQVNVKWGIREETVSLSCNVVPIKEGDELKGYVFSNMMLNGEQQFFPSWNGVVLFDRPDLVFLAQKGQEFPAKVSEGSYVDFNDVLHALYDPQQLGVMQLESSRSEPVNYVLAWGADKRDFVRYEYPDLSEDNAFPKIAEKDLEESDDGAIRRPWAKTFRLDRFREVVPFFSRCLDYLAPSDEGLARVKELLATCTAKSRKFNPNKTDPDQKAIDCLKCDLQELQAILPQLVEDYEKQGKKRIVNLLRAIQEMARRALDVRFSPCPERGIPDESGLINLLDFNDDNLYLHSFTKKLDLVRARLREEGTGDSLARQREKLLRAIDFFENSLTAILAKDAEKPLSTKDLTCLEVSVHRMILLMALYVQERYNLPLDMSSAVKLPRYRSNGSSYPDDAQPFLAAVQALKVYSEHLVEAMKVKVSGKMYQWALRHANKQLGVPIKKIDKRVELSKEEYEILDRAAGRSSVTSEDFQGLEADNKVSINFSNLNDKPIEQEIRLQRRDQVVTFTPVSSQGCPVPDNETLRTIAEEAYSSSKYTKRMLGALAKGNQQLQRTSAIEYLNYKLKPEEKYPCNQRLEGYTLSGKHIANLDKPSTAKVILAAKLSGMAIDKSCQEHLKKVLSKNHRRSFFCCC